VIALKSDPALSRDLGNDCGCGTIDVVSMLSVRLPGDLACFLETAARNERDRRHLRGLVGELVSRVGPVDEPQAGRFASLLAEAAAARASDEDPVVVLDADALKVFSEPGADDRAEQLVRDLLCTAERTGTPVLVPVMVLTEAYREPSAEDAIDRALGETIRVIPLDCEMAMRAGELMGGCEPESSDVIAASVAAAAVHFGGGIILTGNPHGIEPLLGGRADVKVHELS
jgi:hypothetical protein